MILAIEVHKSDTTFTCDCPTLSNYLACFSCPILCPQLPLDDFPVVVLGQLLHKINRFRSFVTSDMVCAKIDQFHLRDLPLRHKRDDRFYRLTPCWIWDPDNSDLSNRRMLDNNLLDFAGIDVFPSTDNQVL